MLGEALRLIRTFHQHTQVETALKIGISKSYLCEIESGRKFPTLKLIEQYSEVYRIPASSILFFSENVNRETSHGKAQRFVARKVIKLLRWVEDGASGHAP